jgi:hypothetical protein
MIFLLLWQFDPFLNIEIYFFKNEPIFRVDIDLFLGLFLPPTRVHFSTTHLHQLQPLTKKFNDKKAAQK